MLNLKNDFSIFRHNSHLVYLDSAATSQKPQAVISAITNFYSQYNSNIHRGLYPIAEKATKAVEDVRKKVAKFINAKYPEEIIFTKSATEAVNLVAYTWGRKNIARKDTIITTIMEHHANFVPWQQLAEERNAKFDVIDIDENGNLKIDNYLSKIMNAKLFALTYVSNVLGIINPIEDIMYKMRNYSDIPSMFKKAFAQDMLKQVQDHKRPVILIDASQYVPHMKLDVQKLDCDFLVFTGHKMLAETGVGVLYAKKELLEGMQPFLFGGDMIREVTIEKTTFADSPNKFEAGTLHISGIISLGAAIDYLEHVGFENIRDHEKELMVYCVEKMRAIDGLKIHGPKDVNYRSGVIAFSVEGIHPHDIAQVLGDMQICIRSGHHCAMPLHKKLGESATSRASFYLYNDKQDVDKLIEGIIKAKEILNK